MLLGSYYDLLDPSGGQLDTGKLFYFLTQKLTFGPLLTPLHKGFRPKRTYLDLFGPIWATCRRAGSHLEAVLVCGNAFGVVL